MVGVRLRSFAAIAQYEPNHKANAIRACLVLQSSRRNRAIARFVKRPVLAGLTGVAAEREGADAEFEGFAPEAVDVKRPAL